MPGSLTFPTPNPLTSPFRKADGSYDWEREMDYGWQMVDCTFSTMFLSPAGSSLCG